MKRGDPKDPKKSTVNIACWMLINYPKSQFPIMQTEKNVVLVLGQSIDARPYYSLGIGNWE